MSTISHWHNRELRKGSLSNDDDVGEEVVRKWICVLSTFIASIWTAQFVKCRRCRLLLELNCWGIYAASKSRERKIHGPRMFTRASSIKLGIRKFHVVVVQWTSKKCTKKHDVRAELLFFSQNHLKKRLKKEVHLQKWHYEGTETRK